MILDEFRIELFQGSGVPLAEQRLFMDGKPLSSPEQLGLELARIQSKPEQKVEDELNADQTQTTEKRRKAVNQGARDSVAPVDQPLPQLLVLDSEEPSRKAMPVPLPPFVPPTEEQKVAVGTTVKGKRVQKELIELKMKTQEGLTISIHNNKNAKPVIVGRQGDLKIDHPTISRKHAQITWSQAQGCFLVEDIGSTAGTFFNQGNSTALFPQSIFEIGDLQYEVTKITWEGEKPAVDLVISEACAPALGGYLGRTYQLSKNSKNYCIGSDATQVGLHIQDLKLNPKHAEIVFDSSTKEVVLRMLNPASRSSSYLFCGLPCQ